jgi:tetratricopeptide (TPR) repeat protein
MAPGTAPRSWRPRDTAGRTPAGRLTTHPAKAIQQLETLEDIFDDANGDLAIGELESAVEKYRRCVEIDPSFFDGWHALGMALMKIGRFPEAIEAGKRATELRPNDQIGWTSLSLFYNRNGDIKEAESAGTKAKILGWGGKIAKE